MGGSFADTGHLALLSPFSQARHCPSGTLSRRQQFLPSPAMPEHRLTCSAGLSLEIALASPYACKPRPGRCRNSIQQVRQGRTPKCEKKRKRKGARVTLWFRIRVPCRP
ncbi:hypothetical protein L209DRAFT_755101 [Thermothelomyces heterothallicus CBS 203.75]